MNCLSKGCKNPKPKRGNYCGACRNSMQRYGVSGPERNLILESQDKECLVCKRNISFDGTRSQYSACVDHNHLTGDVRGILCGNCNTWIGYLENNAIDLEKVRLYLNQKCNIEKYKL